MRRRLLLILWLLSDYVLFLTSYAAAYFVRVGWIFSSDLPFQNFMITVALSGAPWLIVLGTTRTFGLTRNQRTVRNGAHILYASLVGVALVSLAYFFLFQNIFSRQLLLSAFVISAAATWAWHVVVEHIMRRALTRVPVTFPTLIIGITRESRHLLALMRKRNSVLVPVGILDAMGTSEKEIEGVPVLGRLNRLEDIFRDRRITHLIQASELEQSLNLLGACRSRGITYMLLPSVLGIVERDERIESLEGKAVTVVSPEGGWWSWFFR